MSKPSKYKALSLYERGGRLYKMPEMDTTEYLVVPKMDSFVLVLVREMSWWNRFYRFFTDIWCD